MAPSLVHRIRVEAHAVWLAVRDPRTPLTAKLFGLVIAAYALSPIDFIPDFIPILGLLDDAILIPFGIWLFEKMVPAALLAEYRAKAERESRLPVAWGGIVIVLVLWALLVWLVWSVAVMIYD
ncbi:YkvA family protein [Stakelama tenebrarum]|uniref:DUF1232 domain-containing protein n=1 Tax=Stakelama tenebrarum TaxID=2711215 RepID=A0A6G6Y946_9SPHN|nr:YkvA family protein [Sphingosinithalassobacter tenebrarum]QIG81327.1 DUF1232 domain-containing protein [Sphingosinithalassobacter tenebrarum]